MNIEFISCLFETHSLPLRRQRHLENKENGDWIEVLHI